MTSPAYRMRAGTVHGLKHVNLNMNNQDAFQVLEFGVPSWGKTFRVGIVSDGCSGIPAFTRTEVGANLLVVLCLARVQELILSGLKVEEIPQPLYHAVTNFLRSLANLVAPASIHWPYPVTFPGSHEFRNKLKAPQRFITDYLMATVIGFVDDGETLVTFQAGDGVIIVNDEIMIVDQNDTPEYPALSVNSAGGGFVTQTYASPDVSRLVLATDGIEELLKLPDIGLPKRLFDHLPDNSMGLQYLLNVLRKQYGDKVGDDLTVVTRELREGGEA